MKITKIIMNVFVILPTMIYDLQHKVMYVGWLKWVFLVGFSKRRG